MGSGRERLRWILNRERAPRGPLLRMRESWNWNYYDRFARSILCKAFRDQSVWNDFYNAQCDDIRPLQHHRMLGADRSFNYVWHLSLDEQMRIR